MILLLGATGCIGQAFARELRGRGTCFIPLSRSAFDYTRFELLFDYVRKIRPELVINAAGSSGRPDVDACEEERMQAFQANTLLPQTVARVCLMTNTPLGHVSSGAIYNGAKVYEKGQMRVEQNLNDHEVRALFDAHPEKFVGFTELDEPNFTFRSPPCSFHAGTKALAEEALRGGAQTYIWRCMPPFSQRDDDCNLLTKLQGASRVYDHITSLSHNDDFARACLDLVDSRAAYGTYNVVNPGAVSIRQVLDMIKRHIYPDRKFHFLSGEADLDKSGAKTPRSSCILDITKLERAGVRIRSLQHALQDSLERWEPRQRTPQSSRFTPELYVVS